MRGGFGIGVAAGIHLEGPFLDPGHPGALPARHFRAYTAAALEELLDAGGGLVRTMTVAPERPGGGRLARHLLRRGVVPAFGHSGSDYEAARSAVGAGIRYVTHLFNAMDGIHHRRPGPVSAFLEDGRVTAELISDGFHVDPAVMRWAARLLSPERICLVSDSVAPCGLRPGRYRFAGKHVRLQGGRVTLADGRLAGSALTLDQAFRVQVKEVGMRPEQAALSASLVPARVLGWSDVGDIAPGKRADLVRLTPGLRVRETYLGGVRVFRKK
jgi:N-acetylglucosamine-6-phosphate deacetylase